MKKTFLARRNALLSPSGLTSGVVALFFVLLLVGVRFIVPDFFLTVFAPVIHVGETTTTFVQTFLSGFKNAETLGAQNERLAAENAALSLQNRTLTEQIADLSPLVLKNESALQGIAAGVVARPPESPYDTLVVRGGSDSGIVLGMEAFGAGGVPLGTVTSVTASFSRITLFSSSGREIHGWVGKSRVPITLVGAGGGAFTAHVPKTASILVGDGVYVPGPGALFVGTVAELESDPASPSVTVFVSPATNLFSVTWVTLSDTGVAFREALRTSSTTP